MEKDYLPYDSMQNADDCARSVFEKMFGNDERVQTLEESPIKGKLRVIAEGTMAPKVFYTDDFVNPITGESGSYEVCCAVTRDQIDNFRKMNCDMLTIAEKTAVKEFENSTMERSYRIIKDYAAENNSVAVSVAYDEHMAENIWAQMKDVIESSAKAKVVIDAGLHSAMIDIIKEIEGDESNQCDTTGPLYVTKNVTLFERSVSIWTYAYAPFDWKNCLVYDEENPKNCKLITYRFFQI